MSVQDDTRVVVASSIRRPTLPPKRLRELAAFVAERERRELVYVEFAIVGRRRMATFNERFLGHAGATDVISFDLAEDPARLSAQIILCWDVARDQARRGGGDPRAELLLYALHGLLHAAGYDDQTAADFQAMHARERELLEAFQPGIRVNFVE